MIWPQKTETWAIAHSPEMLAAIVQLHVKSPNQQGEVNDVRWLFNGLVGAESFSISPMISRPDNFIPLIKGEWVGTEKGSLLKLDYRLFGSTLMFLVFWSVLCLVGAVFLSFFYQEYALALSLVTLAILNFWITIANFKKRVKECSDKILEILR